MKIHEIISHLESIAPPGLQEHYDNAGLITGDSSAECTGIICSLDATEEVVLEAVRKNCNMIVSHHPIIFGGLKKINGKNYVERTIITAIKNDIAIYAIHTNLDNVIEGVNGRIASMLGLTDCRPLSQKEGTLKKLFTFVPADHAEKVRSAIFTAGAGMIGNYSECSFNSEGQGTFKAGERADPFVGKIGERHIEKEWKIEAVFQASAESAIISAMKQAHPYEEVAYDIVNLVNPHPGIGSGLIGELPGPAREIDLMHRLKEVFGIPFIRHTALSGRMVNKLAICGGAGSFLITKSLKAGADAYITSDLKYHEFFDADQQMLLCDIGHYESEQFTIDLLCEILGQKFPTFAVLKTGVRTNPVYYF